MRACSPTNIWKTSTMTSSSEVFSTKVVGAEALLDATSCDDLRFISLFSSIAARGRQCRDRAAYAAANATLEAIAAREAARRGDQCVVRAFGWGPWDGGMVDATLKSRFLDAGVGVIGMEQGAEFFAEHALCSASTAAVVVAAPAARRAPHDASGMGGVEPRRCRCSPIIRSVAVSWCRW